MTVTASTITAGEWTKVATDVQSGAIFSISPSTTKVWYTIRDTGEDPPDAGDLDAEQVELEVAHPIQAAAPIDIYLWPVGTNIKIRVDLPGVE